MRRAALVALAAVGATAIWAAPAAGHAYYVDRNAPVNGDCQVGNPCHTIGQAMAIPDPDPGSPDIVVVEPGEYPENVLLDADRSLLASGPNTTVRPADPSRPTIEITGTATVVGFAIEGPQPVLINGPGRASSNSFDSAQVPDGGADVTIGAGAPDVVVDRNSFSDDGAGTQVGVRSVSSGSPVIRDNTFVGMPTAIQVAAGTPRVESSLVRGGGPAIDANSATVSVLNLTADTNAVADVRLQSASLSLRSSFLRRPIAADAPSSCAIAYSAGPAGGAGSCATFQLANDGAGFVNPGAGDYHLAPESPLIDAGDPLDFSGLDLDGTSRVADGNCDGIAVRDIGAYEFAPHCPSPPVEPPTEPPPADPPPAHDTDPPETEITGKRVEGHSVTMRFRASEPGSTFLCELDDRPYRGCDSPVRYRGLERGRHVFLVKATDQAKNEDPRPARERFRIRGDGR